MPSTPIARTRRSMRPARSASSRARAASSIASPCRAARRRWLAIAIRSTAASAGLPLAANTAAAARRGPGGPPPPPPPPPPAPRALERLGQRTVDRAPLHPRHVEVDRLARERVPEGAGPVALAGEPALQELREPVLARQPGHDREVEPR